MIIESQPITRQATQAKLKALLSDKDELDVEYAFQDSIMNRAMISSRVRKMKRAKDCPSHNVGFKSNFQASLLSLALG